MGLPPWLKTGPKKMAGGGEVEPPHDHHELHAAAAEMLTHISKNDSMMFANSLRNFMDLHTENKEALEQETKDGIGEG